MTSKQVLRLPEPMKCSVVKRVSRFTVIVKCGDSLRNAYLCNTGRLPGLLREGVTAYCINLRGGGGRDVFRLIAVDEVCGAALLDTYIQEKAFERAVNNQLIPWLRNCSIVKKGFKAGSSVLDYLVKCPGGDSVIEVKSAVMRVEGAYASYPDCRSRRGERHLAELIRLALKGVNAYAVFIAALPAVKAFKPNDLADPDIRYLLRRLVNVGGHVKALSMVYEPESSTVELVNPELRVDI